MSERLERLRERIEQPLLVSSTVNLRYLTGFASSNAALLVEPGRATLFTDFRYLEAAGEVEGVEVVETPRNLYRRLAELLSGQIGVESEHLSHARFLMLSAGGAELVPRAGLVETLRQVKDEGELELIRRAARITDEGYARLVREPFVGRSERELAWRLETFLHELGADGPALELVVASGPNAARPHARPTTRTIGAGEAVIVDAGCTIDGYASDCTRTFATGALPAELDHAYDVCLRAQEAGLAAVVPGAEGRVVDAVARAVIEAEGLGEGFGHGLGHGVGLDVHECPWLNPELDSTLVPGTVVTVEPGIYVPGVGGVRIEDLVIVGEDGPEVLSPFTKELLVVD